VAFERTTGWGLGQLAAMLGLTRSKTSNHLSCLRGCGLVVATPEGRQVRYELLDAHLAHALRDLLDVALTVDPGESCPEDPLPVSPSAGLATNSAMPA
jgi:DNA-binding transcriptional ArsR family regulator